MADMKILVPLDGSKFAEAAIPVALGLAKSLDGQIELISVFEDEPVVATWQLSTVEMRSLLIEYLGAISQRIAEVSDVAISSSVVSGPVARSLEEYAARHAPHVIVMSTHGRGPVSRAWLGSIADHVARHVPMPVMLVRPEDEAEVEIADTHRFSNLLVPLDGSDRAEASLEWAARVARACNACLTLIRVVPPPLPLSSPYLPHAIANTREALESGQQEAAEYLRGVARRLEKEGMRVLAEVVTVGVSPASGITRHAEEHAIDLVVITTHGRSGLPRLVLGSVADKVVRAAHTPVLVTRAPH